MMNSMMPIRDMIIGPDGLLLSIPDCSAAPKFENMVICIVVLSSYDHEGNPSSSKINSYLLLNKGRQSSEGLPFAL